jgi:superfamily II DNA or RNA helicase
MNDSYRDFLESKQIVDTQTGLVDVPLLSPRLFDFQRDITAWALRRGRACIFADTGMGKTMMQLEWARCIPGDVLIVAPLAVAKQTVRLAAEFGDYDIAYSMDGRRSGKITATNYERIEKFDASVYQGVVLDESGILKGKDRHYRNYITEVFRQTPYKLACTATPAPNDHMELGSHAEFVGALSYTEMLSMFFVHDGGETQKWRLKRHAVDDYWRWVCSWAVMIRLPSDLGYEDGEFRLPPIHMHSISVESEPAIDELFVVDARTLLERRAARRETIAERVASIAEMVNESAEPWLMWCDLNAESGAISAAIPDAVEIRGSDTMEQKENKMIRFSDGDIRVLVTKPSIAGHGMNWQHCRNMAFVGLSDSFESMYQAIRRCWRFGQKQEVNVYVITSDREGAVVRNIQRKERQASRMVDGMLKHMRHINRREVRGMSRQQVTEPRQDIGSGDGWEIHLRDCVEVAREMDDGAIDYSIFSPPFASLYTYTDLPQDMGNSKDTDAFLAHFEFLVTELYRILRSGRLVSFHCMNLPTSKARDGYIGLRDFRGMLIRMFESVGFIYHSEVCIWKDPVTAMQRTKALGLLHKQIVKDSTMCRQGIADYLVTMRKPGNNDRPAHGEFDHFVGDDFQGEGRFSIDVWQRYASPIWTDINPSDTLQKASARENADERHIAPLQLQVIHRALQIWTAEGDLVFSPFAGIGSEGYESLKLGRRFVGAEIKESYWRQACANLKSVEGYLDNVAMPLFAVKEEA